MKTEERVFFDDVFWKWWLAESDICAVMAGIKKPDHPVPTKTVELDDKGNVVKMEPTNG
jgi:hypothetical protein